MSLTFRIALGLVCGIASAQPSLRVYTEFQRLDPSGNIVAVDKSEHPREVLSPAILRGGHSLFQVLATVPENTPFWVFIGQNPERTVSVTAYKPVYVKRGEALVPDGIENVPVADTGWIGDSAPRPAAQTTAVYWLDVWVPPKTPPGRFRLEVQLNFSDRWIIYPMEMRVLKPAVTNPGAAPAGSPAPPEVPADTFARGPFLSWLCGPGKNGAGAAANLGDLIRRGARQDIALAQAIEAKIGRDALAVGLMKAIGSDKPAAAWCKAPSVPTEDGAEWYLRVRDYIYRTADKTLGP